MESTFLNKIFASVIIFSLTLGVGTASVSLISYQDPELPILLNTTLETKYENNTEWKVPRDTIPRWFEYYNSTSDFKNAATNNNSCASVSQDFGALAEATGIWAVCQDSELPPECFNFPTSPCYPILNFDNGRINLIQIRTIKISYVLHGMAAIRFVSATQCFDISKRPDPFSSCQFIEDSPSTGEDEWSFIQLTFDGEATHVDSKFSLEIISRFANDLVILEKVEVVEYARPCAECDPSYDA
ncbi:unnamed protein product [Orchesella dallaii]|uniref:Uncharacterized protein n=1 Tax=Orchesella dallaii TaxID=48710 RepID=A0ABP1S0V9_9HEXA